MLLMDCMIRTETLSPDAVSTHGSDKIQNALITPFSQFTVRIGDIENVRGICALLIVQFAIHLSLLQLVVQPNRLIGKRTVPLAGN